MKNKAELYLRGQLMLDSQLITFGDKEQRDNAFQLLETNGYAPIRARHQVLLIDSSIELFYALKKFVGKALEFAVSPLKVTRSLRQNRFYWGVLVGGIIAEHKKYTGEVLDKNGVHLHNIMVIWGWKPEIETVMGQDVIRIDKAPSSSSMTKIQFSQFLDKIFEYYSYPSTDREMTYELWKYIDEGDGTYNQYITKYGKRRY